MLRGEVGGRSESLAQLAIAAARLQSPRHATNPGTPIPGFFMPGVGEGVGG